MINGKSYRVSNGNKDVVIGKIDEKVKNAILIMTIHGSKGCTFDTTLLISTKNARSIGGTLEGALAQWNWRGKENRVCSEYTC